MPNMLPYVKKSLRFDRKIRKHNKQYDGDPDYFRPYGITVFYGDEGSGKTLTLMHVYTKLNKRYPHAKTVSNIKLTNMQPVSLQDHQTTVSNTDNRYYHFLSKESFMYAIQHIRNGKYGVIQINDEYQNYFSNQDSKNVPPALIEQSAQNRKQRRLMLCTSQDYDQLAKAIRRRADLAIKCRTYKLPFIGYSFTVYWAYNAKRIDFENSGKQTGDAPLRMGWFFHSVALRDSYDTSQIISFTGDASEGVYRDSLQALAIVPPSSRNGKRRFLAKKR